jgi:polysaccharide deacetylase family protein (PEP-CTERM system associated)
VTADPRLPAVVLTIDFEDWHQLVLRRIGRADWQEGSGSTRRHVNVLLDLLDELGARATFFVAGVAADRHPAALRDVYARGHELASHGYEHRRAFRQGPDEFRRDVARGIDTVERICGVTPGGYRAPWFSITRDSAWAHDVLRELGVRYDSSLFDSPRIPHRLPGIPGGPALLGGAAPLWELPIAVWRRGRVVLPVGGGAYWRALPEAVLWRALDGIARERPYPVLYFHPYEFAPEPLRIDLPAGSTTRERLRERRRSASKNARRGLIARRLHEAAARYRLVSCREALDDLEHDRDATVLRPARALA